MKGKEFAKTLQNAMNKRLNKKFIVSHEDIVRLHQLSALEMPEKGTEQYEVVTKELQKMIGFTKLVEDYKPIHKHNSEVVGNPLIGNLRQHEDISEKQIKFLDRSIQSRD